MTLQDILRTKGSAVQRIGPDATLDEVVRQLVHHNIGSLVVCDDRATERSVAAGNEETECGEAPDAACGPSGAMLGIITERDILRACAESPLPLDQQRVAERMTAQPVTGSPQDSVSDTMGLMTRRRIRHLPIVEDGRLCGLISIGDVVKAQHDNMVMENHYLKSYIQS